MQCGHLVVDAGVCGCILSLPLLTWRARGEAEAGRPGRSGPGAAGGWVRPVQRAARKVCGAAAIYGPQPAQTERGAQATGDGPEQIVAAVGVGQAVASRR